MFHYEIRHRLGWGLLDLDLYRIGDVDRLRDLSGDEDRRRDLSGDEDRLRDLYRLRDLDLLRKCRLHLGLAASTRDAIDFSRFLRYRFSVTSRSDASPSKVSPSHRVIWWILDDPKLGTPGKLLATC